MTYEEACRKLYSDGINSVTFDYHGYGDNGCIESLRANCDQYTIDGALETALENKIYELLPGGWEIDAGSQGDGSIDTQTGAINIDHGECIEYIEWEAINYDGFTDI